MLQLLHRKGYEGEIVMPVILYAGQLYHPGIKEDGEFIRISVLSAVDQILREYSEKKHLTVSDSRMGDLHDHSNFSNKDAVYYLVCANFQEMARAKRFVRILKMNGYPQSNCIYFQKKYRVYSHKFRDKKQAASTLEKVKEDYRGTYMLNP